MHIHFKWLRSKAIFKNRLIKTVHDNTHSAEMFAKSVKVSQKKNWALIKSYFDEKIWYCFKKCNIDADGNKVDRCSLLHEYESNRRPIFAKILSDYKKELLISINKFYSEVSSILCYALWKKRIYWYLIKDWQSHQAIFRSPSNSLNSTNKHPCLSRHRTDVIAYLAATRNGLKSLGMFKLH